MSRHETHRLHSAAALAVAAALSFAPAAAGDDPLQADAGEAVASGPVPGSSARGGETADLAAALPGSRPPDCSGLSALGARLLVAVSGDGARNAMVSPLGVGAVLAMLAQGGAAPVRAAIRDLAGEAPACALAAIADSAAADERVEARIANGAFADSRFDLFPAFLFTLRERFGAGVERLDFADAGAVEAVNAWASEKTDGVIPSVLERLDPDGGLVLVNAIHFRGEWKRGFDPERTAPAPFRPRSGPTIEVPAMRAGDLAAGYRADDDFEAVSLSYGDGGFAFAAVLPRADMAPEEALERLAEDPSWLAGEDFFPARGALRLPRLALDGQTGLLPVLRRLGLADALADVEAFAGIAAPPPVLGQVVQRVVIEVEESGTTAAAVTAVGAVPESIPIPIPFRFNVRIDRPFAFSIRHVATGAVLFAAWVDNPAAG